MTLWESLGAGPSPSVPTVERKRKSAPQGLEAFQAAPPKRRQSSADTMIRIQPKPSPHRSPLSVSTSPTGHQPKKRGRPSKADIEARNAAAIKRGEVIPPKTPATRDSKGGDITAGGEITVADVAAAAGIVAVAPTVVCGPPSVPSHGISFQG